MNIVKMIIFQSYELCVLKIFALVSKNVNKRKTFFLTSDYVSVFPTQKEARTGGQDTAVFLNTMKSFVTE